ncbi:O-antigen/teichoic acid export membrane protein [Runella defluvii]|uniref:O-antigen/teichoic acid export membrane protein n=1 Tax=Runella defluvii TaxID=370973 RepID=A0A7W5ZIC6_9BACT|nr:hypothetical protein [Runella defluvii]MBB3836419.1 O-antigen/teichoic acid export membrane protein [Runella defluvii]
MSSVKRIISGSLASWGSICLNLVIQIMFVPIYLTYWTIETYSIWISCQALMSFITIFERSHQTFLGFEFLKIKNTDVNNLNKTISSGILIGLLLGFIQCLAVLLLIKCDFLRHIFVSISSLNLQTAGYVLFILTLSNLLSSSVGGILVRAVTPFGYYPRMAWWGILSTFSAAFFPLFAVTKGGDLITVSIVTLLSTFISSLFIYFDLYLILKRENIRLVNFSLQEGITNLRNSTIVAIKEFFDNIRQQGTRTLISPFLSPNKFVTFTTIRTGSNIALQGLNTVVNPLMPELVKFLHQKDQDKVNSSISVLWAIVILFMSPAVTILQVYVEPLYLIWTRNKTSFDPYLFSLLSISVLIYAITQPAISIITGNNLLKYQLILSIVSGLILVLSLVILVPKFNLIGIGVSLVFSECTLSIGYHFYCKRWLSLNKLKWPNNLFNHSALSVFCASFSMLLLAYYTNFKILIMVLSISLQIVISYKYVKALPNVVVNKIYNFFLKKKT